MAAFCTANAQNEGPAGQAGVFEPEMEVLGEIGINRVFVTNNAVSNGISGIDMRLYLNYPQASFLGGQYELLVKLTDSDGSPVLVQNRFGAYADEAGEFGAKRSFRISKYRPVFGESDGMHYKLYDIDRATDINFEPSQLGARISAFLPYYAMNLPKGETAINARFFIKKNEMGADGKYRLPANIHDYSFIIDKPGSRQLKVSVSEVEVEKLTPGGLDWDLNLDIASKVSNLPPDLQWKAVLATEYVRENVYTSTTADNTYFNRWHYEYSPTITVSRGDQITFEVDDADWLKNPDFLGSVTLSVDSLLQCATQKTELSAGSVKRMTLNMPKIDLILNLREIAVSNAQAWDVSSALYKVQPPDLYCIVKKGNGQEVLKTAVAPDAYQVRLPHMPIEMELALDDELLLEIYDKDLFFDDPVAFMRIPVTDIFRNREDGWFRLPDGTAVRLTLD